MLSWGGRVREGRTRISDNPRCQAAAWGRPPPPPPPPPGLIRGTPPHVSGEQLQQHFSQHKLIPVALGGTTREHKVRALCHALWAETQSGVAMESCLADVVAITTDQGTEFGIAAAAGGSYRSYLGHSETPVHEGGAAAQGPVHVFPRAVESCGLLHVADNMVKAADEALSFWKSWVPGLCQLSYLFGKTWLRERFVSEA